MLKLYYAPGACSTASHIGLEESGATYDSQALSFAGNEQKTPEYLKINPRGRVPALVIDEGTIVENTAILDYVAARHAPQLMPADPLQRAGAISLMAWFSNNVHPSFTHISRRRWAGGSNYQRNLFVAFQRLCPGEIAPVVFAGRRARGLVANSGRHARAIAGVRRHWGARRRRPVRPHGDVPIRQNYCRGNADQVVQSRQHAARPLRLPVRSLASINAVVVFPTACGGRDTVA